MYSLFIDTHDTSVFLAIYKDEELYSKLEVKDSHAHSKTTMPILVKLLNDNKIDVHDIHDIVVVNGPGSFTGERLGVTIAKTLAYTLNIPIRTITSLEMHLNGHLEGIDYLSIPEKNGYFIGRLEKDSIIEYKYLSKQEYQELIKNNNVKEEDKINYDNLIKNAHKKKPLNPHSANPFYVKKIEVEKWF